ncbi:MAG: hypothetical protein WCX86_12520 [Candidatus Hydrogenedentales bacterium]
MEIIFTIFRNLGYMYYVNFLGVPYKWLERFLGEDNIHEGTELVFKVLVSIALLFILLYLIRLIHAGIRSLQTRRQINKSMEGYDVREPYTVRDTTFVDELDMVQHPLHTLAQLKKEKRYGHMAELFSRLNQPEEAGRWFVKDKQYKRAAEEMAKAGQTTKAARMLLRMKEYETAARFFAGVGNYSRAASALYKNGDMSGAASMYAEGKEFKKAATMFSQYFVTTQDSFDIQIKAADLCYRWLQKNEFTDSVPIDDRNHLFLLVAARFLKAGRSALAATLYQEGGDTRRAGEIYRTLPR